MWRGPRYDTLLAVLGRLLDRSIIHRRLLRRVLSFNRIFPLNRLFTLDRLFALDWFLPFNRRLLILHRGLLNRWLLRYLNLTLYTRHIIKSKRTVRNLVNIPRDTLLVEETRAVAKGKASALGVARAERPAGEAIG